MKRTHLSLLSAGAAVAAAALVLVNAPRRGRLRRGNVAVITGGSRGLGLALAHEFGRAGLCLVLGARNMDELQRARGELLAAGGVVSPDDVLLVACDVSDREQAAHLIQSALEEFGNIDVLVNDAGIIEVGPVESQPLEAFERAMAVNFFGALHTCHAAMPHFLRKRAGAIVNISSIGGKMAVPHLLPYVASKFALTGYSEGLHAELRHKRVRVTTVCPGLMRSGGEDHAHFRGQVEKEKRWFMLSARTPGLSADVHHAAARIVAAVDQGRAEITITPQAWVAARLVGLMPETVQLVSAYINEYLLPDAN